MITTVVFLLLTAGLCRAEGCARNDSASPSPGPAAKVNSVDAVLKKLEKQTLQLESYEAQIEYLFSQPLLDSKTLRKGVLYYQKAGEKSLLRINFQMLKQDDEQEQKYVECYIFDGMWLTHIDYQIKTAKRHQLAEPNEPMDAFKLASRNFPIVGFTETAEIKKQFTIKQIPEQEDGYTGLHLRPKADSVYKENYTSIELWIDKKYYLPAKITAVSTEKDIYQIRLIEPKVNKRIEKEVFELNIPDGFDEQIIPLKKEEQDKEQQKVKEQK